MSNRFKTSLVAVAVALTAAACAPSQQSNVNTTTSNTANKNANAQSSSQPSGAMSGNDHTNMNHGNMNHGGMDHGAMNHQMMDHANMKSSPNAASAPYDLQFLDTMIPHHQGAVDMARPAVEKAAHPELREFARRIIADQEREIAEMRRIREQHFAGKPQAMNMEMPGMMDSMKGMDMKALNAATGSEFDLMFIEQMIPHHDGAVLMSRDGLGKLQLAEVKTFADQIIASQQKEVAQMNEWKKAWGGAAASRGATSSYAGQETRDIKALSDDEMQAYLQGKGMGLAKAAELNRYPGPMHVLELTGQLELSPEQRNRTQALREAVVRDAVRLGRQIVEREESLDRSFAQGVIGEDNLRRSVGEIARLQGELREVHLRAHLAMRRVLSPAQITRYTELRGYGAGGHQHHAS